LFKIGGDSEVRPCYTTSRGKMNIRDCLKLEETVKCTHVIQPHVLKWMHTAPYFSIISYVDCDVSFCSEYLYLRCLMLLQEARIFIHKWSVIKNAANATMLKLITCSERARLRFVRTFITSVNR